MNPLQEYQMRMTRRALLANSSKAVGAAALASLTNGTSFGAENVTPATENGGLPGLPHFAPKAKRVIYMFMCGPARATDYWNDLRSKVVSMCRSNVQV
jgi:hypothetical protein